MNNFSYLHQIIASGESGHYKCILDGASDPSVTAVDQLRKPSLTQSPSDTSLRSSNGTRRPSPNILLPTTSSPLPGTSKISAYQRRLSVPLPQGGIFSSSPNASNASFDSITESQGSSVSRRPSYVSLRLADPGRTLINLYN